MNKELFESLDILEKEKGISKEYMIERIEAALLSAFRKENAGNENARVKLDPLSRTLSFISSSQLLTRFWTLRPKFLLTTLT